MSAAPVWPAPDPANPYRAARERVAAALSGLGVPVHDTPPQVVAPPCLLILPARTGWMARNGYVGLIVRVVAAGTGEGLPALTRLEDAVWRARAALRAAGIGPGDVDGPAVGEDRLTCDIPLTIRAASI